MSLVVHTSGDVSVVPVNVLRQFCRSARKIAPPVSVFILSGYVSGSPLRSEFFFSDRAELVVKGAGRQLASQ